MKKFLSIIATLVLGANLLQGQWQMVWSDEFNYSGLPDGTKWSFVDWAPKTVNNELQRYVPNRLENCRVENGNLVIEARRDWYNGDEYSSARIHSSGKASWLYGRMEARIKLPGGWGTWPAFWMMPEDITKYGWNAETNYWWPNSGEIDIMEEVGCDAGWINGSVHSAKYYFKKGNQRTGRVLYSDAESAYHVYAIEWYSDRIDFFVDNNKYFTVVNDGTGWESYPFDQNFHIIFNLAVGGDWGGYKGVDPNIWPRQMLVDYVRVYKPAPCTTFNIPSKIEAEKYCQMNGVQLESCSEGTQNVGWIDNGDWMTYNISVATAGSYKVSYRVASPNTGATLRLDKDAGATILGSVSVPNTGGWQNWTTVSNIVNLPAGNYTIGLNATTGGCNINWIDIQINQSYSAKIEAESYASMSGIQTESCSEGTQNVGWIDANDWMSYNVNLPYSGTYTIKYRVASPNSTGVLILSKNATDQAVSSIPNTGGWQNWTTVTTTANLQAGQQSLALYARAGGFNVNWWSIDYGTLKSAQDISTNVNTLDDNQLNVYPNPAREKLYIQLFSLQNNIHLSVVDFSGRVVISKTYSESIDNIELNIASLKSGMYLLKVDNQEFSKMTKIIKK